MALLESMPSQRMQITNLNKALFYLDLAELLETGATLTGTAYIALPAGPVVAKYQERLVDALEQAGLARQVADGTSLPLEVVRPMGEFQFVGPAARKRAVAVARKIGPMSAAIASEFSHENPGWRLAYADGLGANKGGKAVDMLIALQQFGGDEDWLCSPSDETMMTAFSEADRQGGEPW